MIAQSVSTAGSAPNITPAPGLSTNSTPTNTDASLLDPAKLYEVRYLRFKDTSSAYSILIQQKLQACQRRIVELEGEVRLLQAENQHLTLMEKARNTRGKGRKEAPVMIQVPLSGTISAVPGGSSKIAYGTVSLEEITRWGNHFSIFYYPFVGIKHFEEGKNLKTCGFQPHNACRWDNEKNHIIGVSLELYNLVPAKHHPTMMLTGISEITNHDNFARKVSNKIILKALRPFITLFFSLSTL